MNKGRFFLQISFEGTNYHGWQFQPNAISVQEKIEEALGVLLQQKSTVFGCGRTDTGVHASDFYLHLDLDETKLSAEEFKYKLNHLLPLDIAVLNVYKVEEDVHARFHASSREYRYYLYQEKNPFFKQYASFFSRELDVDLMQSAGKLLFNHKDFSAFSKAKTDTKTNDCSIFNFEINKLSDGRLEFVIEANRFLRNMVRAIVGTLLDVGVGKLTLESFEEVILLKNRSKAGVSVPANGLFLHKVNYPSGLLNNPI